LHNSIGEFVAEQEAKTKFSFSRDGKTYFYGDDVTQRLYKDMLKEQNDLAQKGNPYEYWAYVFRKNGNNIAADQLATTAAASEQAVSPAAPVRQEPERSSEFPPIPE